MGHPMEIQWGLSGSQWASMGSQWVSMGSQWGLWPHGPDAAAMLKAEAQHTAWAQRHGVGGEHRWERGGIAWGGQRGQGGR